MTCMMITDFYSMILVFSNYLGIYVDFVFYYKYEFPNKWTSHPHVLSSYYTHVRHGKFSFTSFNRFLSVLILERIDLLSNFQLTTLSVFSRWFLTMF